VAYLEARKPDHPADLQGGDRKLSRSKNGKRKRKKIWRAEAVVHVFVGLQCGVQKGGKKELWYYAHTDHRITVKNGTGRERCKAMVN